MQILNDKVIDFKTAELAKEVGFDQPVKALYEHALTSNFDEQDGYSGSFGWRKGETKLTYELFLNNSEVDFSSKNWFMCAAPTQSLLQKWLREKYNIHIVIDRSYQYNELHKDYGKFVGYRIYLDNGNIKQELPVNGDLASKYFTSYEKALEEGLNISLNLLKNEK